MITQITKIKNLGIFNDYSADADLPDFKQFNLIYGWNGTGKTTLSELFTAFNDGTMEEHPSLEYKFKCNGETYSQNKWYDKNIRVFNQKYIAENIDVVLGNAKSIFILGKANQDLIKVIQQDEKILNGDPEKADDLGKIKELNLKQKELKAKEREKNTKFTDVARIISANTSGVSSRKYNKSHAETAFNQLQSKVLLSDEEIQQHSTTLKQQQKQTLSLIKVDVTKDVEQIILDSTSILDKTVKTVIIDRLKEHADISKWVEEGIKLHKESTICEFCNQSLPENRIPNLLSYFNDADKALKTDIDILLDRIRSLYSSIDKLTVLDKANLYDEFQEDYETAIKKVNGDKTDLLSMVEELGKKVKNKKQHTTEQLKLTINIDTTSFISAITAANLYITNCNTKTKNFAEAKTLAERKLENHYLSEIYDDINKLAIDITRLNTEITYLNEGNPKKDDETGITGIQARISENKTKVSVSGTACDEINKQLKTFLGRDELHFEVEEEGYKIKRKGKPAKNLSEGEKTAIAFVYFTIHLKDRNFDIQNGIIVIDDPISSLDSNSLFQAFAFLKNAVKGVEQIFILTHNFDFLKLLLGWLKRMGNAKQYYMVKNSYDSNNDRVAKLDQLDNLLKQYDTEYQYLFKLLSKFESDGTIASVYHIPNIARKTLEYFLTIMVPNNENMFKKMEKLTFDENKKTAIYKFTNNQSHITGNGFDPSLVSECQNNVKYLLEMIEEVFPAHYRILMESNQ